VTVVEFTAWKPASNPRPRVALLIRVLCQQEMLYHRRLDFVYNWKTHLTADVHMR
jgi:hypothetical protein